MMDLRFATALQLMLSLALAEEHDIRQLSSSDLADGLGVAPSFVRKLVQPLLQDGLLTSSMGKNGGIGLARATERITLKEIYLSVTEEKQLWRAREDIAHRCLVTSNIVPFFNSLTAEATQAVMATLEGRTLRDSLNELRRIDGGQ